MAHLNRVAATEPVFTAEGGKAQRVSPELQLRRSVMACLLWEDAFYESGESIEERISGLCTQVSADVIKKYAVEARDKMHLRHVPLLLVTELLKKKDNGAAETIAQVIQRADELGELLSIYWRKGKVPLAKQLKKGLAQAFKKFGFYALAKYNSDKAIKLRDVAFLTHPKPKDLEQARLWAQLVNKDHYPEEIKTLTGLDQYKKLTPPDTWEVALSAGMDKKATWERLMQEEKLGGLAFLRNLRNMQQVDVDLSLISAYAKKADVSKVLPFRFLVAAKQVPKMEPVIEEMFFNATNQLPKLLGKTILIIDVSGSMYGGRLSKYSEMDRAQVACSLATLARELCENPVIYATAGNDGTRIHQTALVPARHGFALTDAIYTMGQQLGSGGIFLKPCIDYVKAEESTADRIIVVTDEQDCAISNEDAATKAKPFGKHNYIINVSVEKNGVGYGNGWHHIDGFSESILTYIREYESEGQNGEN